MPHSMIILYFPYRLVFASEIVLYFFKSTLALLVYINLVLTLSMIDLALRWRHQGRLTRAHDVTIHRFHESHTKRKVNQMNILWCMGSKFRMKLQTCPLKFNPIFYWVCDYLSMLRLKLIHVSKRGHRHQTNTRANVDWGSLSPYGFTAMPKWSPRSFAHATTTVLSWHAEQTNFTNPRMHLFHIPQCSIQNRNVHISVLNGALWDMKQATSGISELGQFLLRSAAQESNYSKDFCSLDLYSVSDK